MILLDTHALLWWQAGGQRLSDTASREIARSDIVLISPVSCWEIATLRRKSRISLDRDLSAWIRDLFAGERVELAPLTAEAGAAAGSLDESFPGDPADRLLWSTARDLVVPFVTRDEAIHAYATGVGGVRLVW